MTLYRILVAMSVFVSPLETLRRTDTEEGPDETAQQTAADQRGPDKAQFQGFEALLSGSNERDDEANCDGAQSDVQEGVRGGVLVAVQTAGIIVVIGTATAE